MTSVDAGRDLTLCDASGEGYAASAYNKANPVAFIPELHNDEIRHSDGDAPSKTELAEWKRLSEDNGFVR